MSLRAIIVIILVLAVGWSGYWWVNAGLRRDAVETWFAERQADGWVADYGDLRVTGFPNRVDTILTDVQLADPGSGWSWEAPRFELLTLSYRPFEIIAVWPGRQVFASPWQRVEVEGEVLRASLAVSANGAFELQRSRIEGRQVQIDSSAGWALEVPVLAVATEVPEGTSDAALQRLGITVEDMAVSGDLRRSIDPAGLLPERVDSLHLDATATFAAPLSLRTLEQDLPPVDALSIADVSAVWGQLDLRAQGELEADARGYAQGNLDLRARNWEQMLELAVANGVLDEGTARAASFGLGLLAAAGGDRNTLDAPLSFRDGQTRLGPLGLGSAPRLR